MRKQLVFEVAGKRVFFFSAEKEAEIGEKKEWVADKNAGNMWKMLNI